MCIFLPQRQHRAMDGSMWSSSLVTLRGKCCGKDSGYLSRYLSTVPRYEEIKGISIESRAFSLPIPNHHAWPLSDHNLVSRGSACLPPETKPDGGVGNRPTSSSGIGSRYACPANMWAAPAQCLKTQPSTIVHLFEFFFWGGGEPRTPISNNLTSAYGVDDQSQTRQGRRPPWNRIDHEGSQELSVSVRWLLWLDPGISWSLHWRWSRGV